MDPPPRAVHLDLPEAVLHRPVPPAATVPVRAPNPVAGGAVILVGLLLVAFNLRVAITSLGALLTEVRAGLQLSGVMAGLLTTLPVVAFAGFGALAPWLLRRIAPARVLAAAMVALAAGQALRAVTDSAPVFLGTSALALSGIALANVLMPMLVKQHFPHRVGLITGAYTTVMTAGTATGAALAVPVAHAFGSWRAGLSLWAGLALLAALPWLPMALRRVLPVRPQQEPTTTTATSSAAPVLPAAPAGAAPPDGTAAGAPGRPAARIRPGRSGLGWAMAVYFGTQSLSAYAIMGWLPQLFRDAGFRPQDAGLLLSGVTAFGVPIALLVPAVAARIRTLHPLVLSMAAAMVAAYAGLLLAPHRLALLWVLLLAYGQSAFPLILTAFGLRARTADGTVALSAFAQSTGYLLATLGPLLVGLLYERTGGWPLPIGFLLVALAAQTVAGTLIARPRYIEDQVSAVAGGAHRQHPGWQCRPGRHGRR